MIQVETPEQAVVQLKHVLRYLWAYYGGTEAAMIVSQTLERLLEETK